ncbi:relaxase domain-containing protein [Streptomyces sp. NPDC056295]|uniref:relaxase domain-containing protein n=1 Tax=Streptomyces sp. NPDC056295 TaxID=3345774 RepID=UPI0035D9180E
MGTQGRYFTRPVHGLAVARFRHYESRAGTPLLHGRVLISLRGLRPDGKWGAVHSKVLFENTVAASSPERAADGRGVRGAGPGLRVAHRQRGASAGDGGGRGAARADRLDVPARPRDRPVPS